MRLATPERWIRGRYEVLHTIFFVYEESVKATYSHKYWQSGNCMRISATEGTLKNRSDEFIYQERLVEIDGYRSVLDFTTLSGESQRALLSRIIDG